MLDDINAALRDYYTRWQELVDTRKDGEYFKELKPVTVGWKVADLAQYDDVRSQLRPMAGLMHERRMNNRWLSSIVLEDVELEGGICVIKLMQRRPASDDPLGLDHVDFYTPDVIGLEEMMDREPDLKATQERNDALDNYSWISIWFDGTEAKIKQYTVLKLAGEELQTIEDQIIAANRTDNV